MNQRLHQLDALRGLAAVSVILGHFCQLTPDAWRGSWWWWALNHTPLAIVQAGHQAVVLFFVLSGFVLSLPFLKGPVEPRAYLLRRACRILVPYWVTTVVALLALRACGGAPVPALGSWFNEHWQASPAAREVLVTFSLIGVFNAAHVNSVVWSLVIEMRVSLIFPWLMAGMGRLRTGWALVVSCALSLVGFVLSKRGAAVVRDWGQTLYFLTPFVAGILLARHREAVVAWLGRCGRWGRWAQLAAGVMGYTAEFWLPRVGPLKYVVAPDALTTVGAVLLVALALASLKAQGLLAREPFRFLGLTSYSIYLYHVVLLLALGHAAYGVLGRGGLMLAVALATPVVAAVSYRLVELPSIAWGRAATRWLAERDAARAG